MTIQRRSIARALLLCGAVAAVPAALAQTATDFPTSQIKILVPFAPGGIVDLMARVVAEKMGAELKQSVIVENRPGANGSLGASALAASPADGHTMLFATNSLEMMNPYLYKKLPYKVEQLQRVSIIYDSSIALVMSKKAKVTNFQELMAYAKSKPDGLTYGSWGAGSSAHLFSELMRTAYNLKMVHVPYKGEIAALTDMARMDLDITWASPNGARNFRDQGSAVVLGVSGTQRSPALSEVPTFAEQGLNSVSMGLYAVAYVPAGTPVAAANRLQKAINNAVSQPDVKARFATMGLIPVGSTAAEADKVFARDTPIWKKAAEVSGASLD